MRPGLGQLIFWNVWPTEMPTWSSSGPILISIRRMVSTWLIQCDARTRPYPFILLGQPTLDSVINAFRSGARGVFSRQQEVAEFVSCVEHVRKGFIWAGTQETALILDAFSSIPSPDLVMDGKSLPLTLRELQVVKCAARGETNKAIAKELGLSEHTVKNYLFRAFEKLGVSNRVELLFHLTQRGQTLGRGTAECVLTGGQESLDPQVLV